jgi:hypothetical protein
MSDLEKAALKYVEAKQNLEITQAAAQRMDHLLGLDYPIPRAEQDEVYEPYRQAQQAYDAAWSQLLRVAVKVKNQQEPA